MKVEFCTLNQEAILFLTIFFVFKIGRLFFSVFFFSLLRQWNKGLQVNTRGAEMAIEKFPEGEGLKHGGGGVGGYVYS